MNINPTLWGPCAWDFFYFIALSYPKNPSHEDKLKYKNYFILSGEIMPCDKCKVNFKKPLTQLPIDNYLSSSYNLFTWVTKMQNKVRLLNKKEPRSVDENFQYYLDKINNNHHSSPSLSNKEKILIGFVCIGFFLFLLKKMKKI